MLNCSCSHAPSEHASAAQFGQRMCLVAGCDCNGGHEEVVEAYVQRSMAKKRVLHDLCDVIMTSVHVEEDAAALDIATVILEKFNVEKK